MWEIPTDPIKHNCKYKYRFWACNNSQPHYDPNQLLLWSLQPIKTKTENYLKYFRFYSQLPPNVLFLIYMYMLTYLIHNGVMTSPADFCKLNILRQQVCWKKTSSSQHFKSTSHLILLHSPYILYECTCTINPDSETSCLTTSRLTTVDDWCWDDENLTTSVLSRLVSNTLGLNFLKQMPHCNSVKRWLRNFLLAYKVAECIIKQTEP